MSLHNRRATDIVADRGPRTPEKSVRTDSHPTLEAVATLDGVRAVSHLVRIDAKRAFLANINEARTRLKWSVDAMAAIVGVPTSQMSEALAGKDGRNFAGHWLTALGPDFERTYNQVVDEQRGDTPEAKQAIAARALGSLVEQFALRIKDIA